MLIADARLVRHNDGNPVAVDRAIWVGTNDAAHAVIMPE